MRMEMRFPGGLAVDASWAGRTIHTDQAEIGGAGKGPAPSDLSLASIGTCAAFYTLRFCQQRSLSTTGLSATLEPVRDDESRRIRRLRIDLDLPEGFPPKYRDALLRSVDQCAVKRHIVDPPEFEVTVVRSTVPEAPRKEVEIR